MCCEHCHMRFIGELFEDSRIIAADSNFKLGKPAFDIEYTIAYLDTHEEKEIREFITNKLIEIGIIKK